MQKRILALLLCAVLCAMLVFSYAFIVLESDHDCTQEDCQVCLDLQACHGLLRSLSYAGSLVILAASMTFLLVQTWRELTYALQADTPVSLKVKLLN